MRRMRYAVFSVPSVPRVIARFVSRQSNSHASGPQSLKVAGRRFDSSELVRSRCRCQAHSRDILVVDQLVEVRDTARFNLMQMIQLRL